ncbi:MAG: hypothetical protein ABJO67_21285 [Pseudoruegeria sp.]
MDHNDAIADELARQTLAIIEKTGEIALSDEIAGIIGASSSTLEESYLTAVRVRRAEKRARDRLKQAALAAGLGKP